MKQAKTEKKNLKKQIKIQKKFFYFKFNSNIIFYLKNCSCKSNLKYLIQFDNKFDNSLESKNFINSVQYINKTIRRRTISFQEKLKKNGSLRSFKNKNSEILAFSNFTFTEFNSHANKNPSYTSFYTFSTST